MEDFILIACVSALVCGALAGIIGAMEKNGAVGALLGIFLGPLGVLIIALMNMSQRNARSRDEDRVMLAYQARPLVARESHLSRGPVAVPEEKRLRIQREGQVLGTWTVEEVRGFLQEGSLVWQDLFYDVVRREWMPLSEYPGEL